jgi:hypothetical protein
MVIHPLWYFCLLVRFSIAVFVWFQDDANNVRIITSAVLLLIGLGFFRKYITGSNDEVQISKVFWHETRVIHGSFYILSSILLFLGHAKPASILILLDILFSIFYRITSDK